MNGLREDDLDADSLRLGAPAFGQDVGIKTGTEVILGWLAHLKFLAIGSIGIGVLCAGSQALQPNFEDESAGESVFIDEAHVTVPVLKTNFEALSLHPQAVEDQSRRRSKAPQAPPRLAVPMPPTDVKVE